MLYRIRTARGRLFKEFEADTYNAAIREYVNIYKSLCSGMLWERYRRNRKLFVVQYDQFSLFDGKPTEMLTELKGFRRPPELEA